MRGIVCAIHEHKTTVPQEKHHIWPLGYHGPNVASNIILICCNAHSDIHYYMEHRLKHNGNAPKDYRTYSPMVRLFANYGYDQVIAYGTLLSREITNG